MSAKVGTFSNRKYPGSYLIPEVEGASQLRGLYEGRLSQRGSQKEHLGKNNNNNKNHHGQQREKTVNTAVSVW